MYKLQLTICIYKGSFKIIQTQHTKKGLLKYTRKGRHSDIPPFLAFGHCSRICEIINFKKRFILVHGFGGFNLWLLGSAGLGDVAR